MNSGLVAKSRFFVFKRTESKVALNTCVGDQSHEDGQQWEEGVGLLECISMFGDMNKVESVPSKKYAKDAFEQSLRGGFDGEDEVQGRVIVLDEGMGCRSDGPNGKPREQSIVCNSPDPGCRHQCV